MDSGAGVVQEALGALNQPPSAQQAVDYAYARGVVVIASAADEESSHNNYPANYSHTVQVNSVASFADVGGLRADAEVVPVPERLHQLRRAHRARVPSSRCSSEATGLWRRHGRPAVCRRR